jgi:hypothetical protein
MWTMSFLLDGLNEKKLKKGLSVEESLCNFAALKMERGLLILP